MQFRVVCLKMIIQKMLNFYFEAIVQPLFLPFFPTFSLLWHYIMHMYNIHVLKAIFSDIWSQDMSSSYFPPIFEILKPISICHGIWHQNDFRLMGYWTKFLNSNLKIQLYLLPGNLLEFMSWLHTFGKSTFKSTSKIKVRYGIWHKFQNMFEKVWSLKPH